MSKPRCYGHPGIRECGCCYYRIECFEDSNAESEWKLLIRAPKIETFEDQVELLDRERIMRIPNVSFRGARELIRVVQCVSEKTGTEVALDYIKTGIILKCQLPRKRTFADVKEASNLKIKIVLREPSALLKKFLPALGKKQILNSIVGSESEFEKLVSRLSIALKDLMDRKRGR